MYFENLFQKSLCFSEFIFCFVFCFWLFFIRELFRRKCTNKSLITQDLEQVTMGGQLRHGDRTMYQEIKDILHYVEMILLMNVTLLCFVHFY